MVESSKSRSIALKKLAKWAPSPTASYNKKTNVAAPLSADAPFSPIYDEQLQQGSLYIIKVKQVSLALFEGKLRKAAEVENVTYLFCMCQDGMMTCVAFQFFV